MARHSSSVRLGMNNAKRGESAAKSRAPTYPRAKAAPEAASKMSARPSANKSDVATHTSSGSVA